MNLELGENRLNGVDALTESLQLPLLGVEAAKRSETVLGRTRAPLNPGGSAIDRRP